MAIRADPRLDRHLGIRSRRAGLPTQRGRPENRQRALRTSRRGREPDRLALEQVDPGLHGRVLTSWSKTPRGGRLRRYVHAEDRRFATGHLMRLFLSRKQKSQPTAQPAWLRMLIGGGGPEGQCGSHGKLPDVVYTCAIPALGSSRPSKRVRSSSGRLAPFGRPGDAGGQWPR